MSAATGSSAWVEIAVEADAEAVEAVSEILARVSPGGTIVEPAFELGDEGLFARIDPGRPAVVRGYVPAEGSAGAVSAAAAVDRVVVSLGHLQAFGLRHIGEPRTRTVREADRADEWKSFYPVMRLGTRLVLRPSWRRHRARDGDVVLTLDPGMAFGTGLHPTTRLCLEAIERLADDGRLADARVLDVGCGSGILAIAAVRLGADRALGVDTDPIAVEATQANARRNRIARKVTAREGSLPTGDEPFDVVLANLVAGLLIPLAPSLRDESRPDGRLVASGIFIDREAEVTTAFEAVGLEVTGRAQDGDWVRIDARRP